MQKSNQEMQQPNQEQKPIITKRSAIKKNLNAAVIAQSNQDLTLPSSLPPLPFLPEERSTRALKPSAIKTIQLKPSTFLTSLRSDLPDALSRRIAEKNPGNIYQIIIASPQKDTGFNEIAWQDQDGSKLYLQNLHSTGVIYDRYKVTYPEVARLAQKSRWKNPLPDTIFVNLKSAGNDMSRMAAKKMVLAFLDSYKNDPELQTQRGFKLPNKLILKEETKTDNPDHGESVITFSVKGITQIEPIMDTSSLLINDKRLLLNLQTALSSYQKMLNAGVVNGFRVEQVAATAVGKKKPPPNVVEAGAMFQAIENAAQSLLNTVNAEIENQKRTGLKKSDIAVLSGLRDQVNSAIDNKFRNELDTWRWQQWRALKPKPRTEDEIVPGTGTQIGAGVQGPVFKYQLDPALGRSPVILKYDNNGLNEDAKGAGLPEVNPQQSVRAVAAFKISKQLQLGVIPQTEFYVGTDDDGRPKLGQAMEFVNGTVGQRKAGLKNDAFTGAKAQHLNDLLSRVNKGSLTEQDDPSTSEKLPFNQWLSARDEIAQYYYDSKNEIWYPKPPIDQNMIDKLEAAQTIVAKLGNLDPKTLDYNQQGMLEDAQKSLDKYLKVSGEWYYADNLPVNINYGNSVVQQGLSDLQVFDSIIGHADRNPGNWIYEKDNIGNITGVKGIDNDDTFGQAWSPGSSAIPRTLGEFSSKTPGIPPIVDISTALSILNADFNKDIRPLLAGLSNDEIDKAAERFDQVQQQVESRVMAGKIASIAPTGDTGVQAKLVALNQLTGAGLTQTLRWGNLGIADTHTETNSYLGFQIAQKAQFGVAPESGVGLALLPA